MAVIKLTKPYEHFTGSLNGLEFKEGLSVEDIPQRTYFKWYQSGVGHTLLPVRYIFKKNSAEVEVQL